MDEVLTGIRPTHTFEWDTELSRWSLRDDTGRYRAHGDTYIEVLEVYLDDMGLNELAA